MVALLVADAAAEPDALEAAEVAAAAPGMLVRSTPAAEQRPLTAGSSSRSVVSMEVPSFYVCVLRMLDGRVRN